MGEEDEEDAVGCEKGFISFGRGEEGRVERFVSRALRVEGVWRVVGSLLPSWSGCFRSGGLEGQVLRWEVGASIDERGAPTVGGGGVAEV